MTVDYNIKAFEFVDKIKDIGKDWIPNPKGSSNHIPVEDISNKVTDSPVFERIFDHDLSSQKILINTKEGRFGFDDNVYPDFYSFIYEVSQIKEIGSVISDEKIEELAIEWITKVQLNKKAESGFIDYLRNIKQELLEDKIYYFPVLNLHIPKPFKIGDVEITYFTKEFFDKKWDSQEDKSDKSKDSFDKLFRRFQGRVLAAYRIKAESKKAKKIAYDKCSLAIDVLKMYTPTILFPTRKCYVDLEEKININYQTNYLSQPYYNQDELGISMSAKNDPFYITDQLYEHLLKNDLSLFSRLLTDKSENELFQLIKQAIIFYSNAISTFDLHFRVAQIITISESLLLEVDRKYQLEKRCKFRYSVLLNSSEKNRNEFNNLLTEMYQIRHKIMHKAIRLRIDIKKLSRFQMSLIELFKRLIIIGLQFGIDTKEKLIIYLDNKNGSAQHAE